MKITWRVGGRSGGPASAFAVQANSLKGVQAMQAEPVLEWDRR
jgi:hypothetical protein